jgi:hypothetical protein
VQLGSALLKTSATSLSLTFPQAQNAGDLIVLAVGWTDSSQVVMSVADTAGNTYAQAVPLTTYSPDLSQVIYYAAGIKAAATNKITVTMNASTPSLDLRALEFAGLHALDVKAAATGKASATSSGNATTTSPYELLVGAGMSSDYYTASGSGYTKAIVSANGNLLEYEVVSAAGSYSATATQASAAEWVMQLAAFK